MSTFNFIVVRHKQKIWRLLPFTGQPLILAVAGLFRLFDFLQGVVAEILGLALVVKHAKARFVSVQGGLNHPLMLIGHMAQGPFAAFLFAQHRAFLAVSHSPGQIQHEVNGVFVQMPGGIPVATMAINGAKNAALLAVEIFALADPALQSRLVAYRKKQTDAVLQATI